VIQNIGGAGGTIAATKLARALLTAATPQIAIVPAMMKAFYDPVRDFAPISVVGTNGFVLAVNKNVPVKTVAEFIAWVKAQPGKLGYAEGGRDGVSHSSMGKLWADAAPIADIGSQ
jgi:tripartite-type tricarboxylate transporter receptor subunit TctC